MPVKPDLARRCLLNFVRLSQRDVDAPAVGLPAEDFAVPEILVGVGEAPVVFGAVAVVPRRRVRVTPLPELLDEALALGVAAEEKERLPFLRGDDIKHVLVQPLLIDGTKVGLSS